MNFIIFNPDEMRAVEFLSRPHERPFVLYLPLSIPHCPLHRPAAGVSRDGLPVGDDPHRRAKTRPPLQRGAVGCGWHEGQ